MSYLLSDENYDELNNTIARLNAENQRLRDALEFYADEENYYEDFEAEPHHYSTFSMIKDDKGHIARQALEKPHEPEN